jgi:hypothetical protein
MPTLNVFGLGAFAGLVVRSNADLGDWLCKMLGICA